MTDGTIPKAEEIYFRIKEDSLTYSVMTLHGEIVIDKKIPQEIIPPPSLNSNEPLSDYVKKNSSKILQYTS
jgi:hypothetical protein